MFTLAALRHRTPVDSGSSKKALDVGAQLVVIDTLIRTLEGDENSADTIKNFYTHTPGHGTQSRRNSSPTHRPRR